MWQFCFIDAILNYAKRGVKETLDVCAYDADKCFDSLWTYECIHDLFEAGLKKSWPWFSKIKKLKQCLLSEKAHQMIARNPSLPLSLLLRGEWWSMNELVILSNGYTAQHVLSMLLYN